MTEETVENLTQKYSVESSDQQVFILTQKSPIGNIIALADDDFVYLLQFLDSKLLHKMVERLCKKLKCKLSDDTNHLLDNLTKELEDYFNGTLKKFTVPLKYFGSDFQESVWSALVDIPYGTTLSYGEMAHRLKQNGGYARAVGAACGANPVLVAVPCHRLLAGAAAGGFSAGRGRKEWLIHHEQKHSSIG